MASKKVKVTYLDGTVKEALASPRAQVMTEQHTSWAENPITATFYLGWAALHKAGKESQDFETWLDLIDDVEEIEKKADPTPPAQSPDTSSD